MAGRRRVRVSGGRPGPTGPRPAAADIVDLEVQDGCLASVAGGVGLFENSVDPAGGISLESPGPVVRVVVEWMGEFESAPSDAGLGLDVTGPSGTASGDVAATPSGTATSRLSPGTSSTPPR